MKKLIAASSFLLLLAACSSFAGPMATALPTSTITAIPTLIPNLTPTSITLPATGTPDPAFDLVPEGQPASEWNGVPVMPGAIAGDGDEEGYIFTIEATPQQVQEYYQLELAKLGWQLLAREAGDSSLMLIFVDNASATLTVSILTKDQQALVLLAK